MSHLYMGAHRSDRLDELFQASIRDMTLYPLRRTGELAIATLTESSLLSTMSIVSSAQRYWQYYCQNLLWLEYDGFYYLYLPPRQDPDVALIDLLLRYRGNGSAELSPCEVFFDLGPIRAMVGSWNDGGMPEEAYHHSMTGEIRGVTGERVYMSASAYTYKSQAVDGRSTEGIVRSRGFRSLRRRMVSASSGCDSGRSASTATQ